MLRGKGNHEFSGHSELDEGQFYLKYKQKTKQNKTEYIARLPNGGDFVLARSRHFGTSALKVFDSSYNIL